VALKNYHNCESNTSDWLETSKQRSEGNQELAMTFEGLKRYVNDPSLKYLHLVGGGITDNLGLRGIHEIVETVGGAETFVDIYGRRPPRRLVIISVDASTEPALDMDRSQAPPSIDETISAVSSAQLHRYNAATMNLIDESIKSWASQLSTPVRPVEPYFIKIKIEDTKQTEVLESLNSIPTNFSLNDQEVDLLIQTGHELLFENPDFQRLLKDINKQ
jgi:NTE family protein